MELLLPWLLLLGRDARRLDGVLERVHHGLAGEQAVDRTPSRGAGRGLFCDQ